MTTIKRTSPGPSMGKVGESKGAKKEIGTSGNTKGSKSSCGGQHPFMPSMENKSNMSGSGKSEMPGQVSNKRTGNFYDFMPMKPEGKK